MKSLKYFFITGIFVLLFSGQAFSQSGWETIFGGTTITGMALQGDNVLCTTTSGIICLNKKTLESKTSSVESENFTDNAIMSVAVDSDNNIWFGTYSGKIIRDDGQKWTIFPITDNLPGSQINMIYCGKDGNIWAGTNQQGLYTFDGIKWEKFSHDFGNENSFVMKMAEDSNNNTWFVTNIGLYMFDRVNLKAVGNDNGFPGDSIISIRSDINKKLWAVSFGGGIFRHDDSNWTEIVKDDATGLNLLKKLSESKTILSQIISLENTYYLANTKYFDFDYKKDCPEIGFVPPSTGNNFEYSFNGNTAYSREVIDINGDSDISDGLTLTTGHIMGAIEGSSFDWSYGEEFNKNVIAAFDVSPDGTLWGGTMAGVVHFNGDKKITFTTGDGLAGGVVTSLNLDSDGTVWVSSQYGLSRYTPSTTQVNTGKDLPEDFKIIGNNPNPFNPQTSISFSLTDEKQISLVVYNINGQEIQTLFSGKMKSGVHSISWNGKNSAGENVSSGIYLAVLKSGAMKVSHRMQLVR